MANWSLPTLTSTYTNFVSEVNGRLNDLALGLSGASAPTNLPEGSIKWNETTLRWEKWVGGSWAELSTTYNINISSASKLSTYRNISISGDLIGTIPFDGSSDVNILSSLSTVPTVSAGTYGSSTLVPIVQVDSKGRVVSISTVPVGASGTILTSNATITGGTISNTDIRIRSAIPTNVEGDIKWNSATDTLTIGTGLNIKYFVDTDSIQVVQNKELSTGSTWHGSPIPVAFGGTSSTNAVDARTALGVGTLGTQNDNTVSILGGIVSNTALILQDGSGSLIEGSMQWDFNDDLLSIGTGAGSKIFVDTDSIQNILNKTYNELSLVKSPVGFTIAGGAISKVLTIESTLRFIGTDNTSFTFPSVSSTLAPTTQKFYLGSTQIGIDRTSQPIVLTGITSIDGLAARATVLNAAVSLNGKSFNGSASINDIPLSVANDISNNTYYPVFATASSGNPAAKVSNLKLKFNPFSGVFSAPIFEGSGTLLTDIGTSNLGSDITPFALTLLDKVDGLQTRIALGASDRVSTNTIWIPAAAMLPQKTNGAIPGLVEFGTASINLKTLDFDKDNYKYAQFAIRMPKGWNKGALKISFTWSNTTGLTGDAIWGAGAISFGDGSSYNTNWTDTVVVLDTSQGANICQESSSATLPINGYVGSDSLLVYIRVYRRAPDTADTLSGPARLHGVILTYETTNTSDL